MKNLCIIFLNFLLIYGCSGRPPVPVNQYNMAGIVEALHITRQITDLLFQENREEMETIRIDLHCQAKANQRQVQKSKPRLVLVCLVSYPAKRYSRSAIQLSL